MSAFDCIDWRWRSHLRLLSVVGLAEDLQSRLMLKFILISVAHMASTGGKLRAEFWYTPRQWLIG
jgi:hypothetical protein